MTWLNGPKSHDPACKQPLHSDDGSNELRQVEQRMADLEKLLEEKDLSLTALREQLRTIQCRYDDICDSLIWRGTQPLRQILDHVKKWRDMLAKLRVVTIDRFVLPCLGALRGEVQWVRLISTWPGNIAIVQAGFGREQTLRLNSLINYLTRKNYLIILVRERWNNKDGTCHDQSTPNCVNIACSELLHNIDCLACPPDRKKLFILTSPVDSLVASVAKFRQAGFAVMYDLTDDWESLHEEPCSREYEEQAVLAADMVSVSSGSLRDKFRDLRQDIQVVMVETDDVLEGTPWDMSIADLLTRVEKGTCFASLYA
jgi:hypothetical protein